MINEIINQVREGLINPLEAYIQLKSIEADLKTALPLINDEAVEEAKKHALKSFKFKGAEITLKSNPGTWDFKSIDSWRLQKEKLKEVEESAKIAYQTKGKSVQFDMNGEEIQPAQYTPGRDNISVRLIKEFSNEDPLKELNG